MPLLKQRIVIVVIALGLIGALFVVGSALWPPFGPPPRDITDVIPPSGGPPAGENSTGMPLKLPPGFSISIFAKDLPGARVMRFDSFGNLWLSRTSEGAVTLLEIDRERGTVRNQSDVFRDLEKPHGLAFDPQKALLLYIAEEQRVWRVTTYSDDPGEEVLQLPSGDGHFTRTIAFGPDNKLYISVGSSCNVCRESDERRASILRYDPAFAKATAGKPEAEIFARGLRNAVFFTWDAARRMWATEMGRDWLGDDLPPDEVNVVEQGRNYGWPICYGKNIHDPEFDKNVYVRNPCEEPHEAASFIDIPAHSAPLGLAFVPAVSDWPEDYWYDLLVAYHGSWNRSSPTGYKVVRHKFDAAGRYEGVEDFITGWLVPSSVGGLTPSGALGRPVDIIVQPGGVVYLSDDKAGVIYKITVNRKP
ncbi:MAG: hypothetical protein A3B37_01940 [Candidatus Sungbacteria bacterium RIFCSPLOWO2_01_FULL_59_16]|uniref:Pyrroloquinoline quinone-dependent pyranose dehydrogenase beta-propeller domain-containing protein n=1 Tax=Candidatus Sungbacteria bacterium RIFCSPLOWO2_01_FULL_59_16 TaxID=1802280 RepID=A0A1G2LCS5_9BACT|nr:MAG: hypothetical protein A3B37_01940 [Candidatus Sungbacteria bacterium RIFCSPLOWO2_01_FULL_59_16]